jgi:hypothetical protein
VKYFIEPALNSTPCSTLSLMQQSSYCLEDVDGECFGVLPSGGQREPVAGKMAAGQGRPLAVIA